MNQIQQWILLERIRSAQRVACVCGFVLGVVFALAMYLTVLD